MAVDDLGLWTALPASEIDIGELVTQLNALARECLPDRWPFLGRLHVGQLLAHPSPEVRAAAIRCFAGASGAAVWPLLLEACRDPVAVVRQAGFDALQTSSAEDPLRWVHVLLGPDRDQLPAALARLPRGFPRSLLFPLLAEERFRGCVLKAIGPLSRPEHTGHLLAAVRAGHLSREAGRDALRGMPWEWGIPSILAALDPERQWPADEFMAAVARDPALSAIVKLLESPSYEDPRLDELLDLCCPCAAGNGGGADLLASILRAMTTSGGPPGWMPQICAGLARQGLRRRDWPPARIAACGWYLPMLLELPEIPPSNLGEGLGLMRGFNPASRPDWWSQTVRLLLERQVFRTPDGDYDLVRVASFPLPWPPWSDANRGTPDLEGIVELLDQDPAGAILMLDRARDWSDADRGELVALIEAAWCAELVTALVDWSLHSPMSAMEILDWFGEPNRAEALRALFDRLERLPEAIGHRECELLAEELLRRLTPGTVLRRLALLEHLKEPASHVLGRRLLHGIAAHDMLGWALEEEPWDLAGCAPARGGHPVRIGDILPQAGRRRYLSLISEQELRGVVELCHEERTWLGRVDADALPGVLQRYVGRPTRGLLPGIRNSELPFSAENSALYWVLAFTAHDSVEIMAAAVAWDSLLPPRLVREGLDLAAPRVTHWSLLGGLLAWSNGWREQAEQPVRELLRRSGTTPIDLITLALRQSSRQILEAVLDVVGELSSQEAIPGLQPDAAALDARTTALLLDLLGWLTGRPWPEGTPQPSVELESALFHRATRNNQLEERLVTLLPGPVLATDPELSARLGWGAAERWRRRRHKGAEARPDRLGEESLLPIQLDLPIGLHSLEPPEERTAAAALWSEDPDVAVAAVTQLCNLGRRCAPHLVRAVTSDPPAPCAVALTRVLNRLPADEWTGPVARYVRAGHGPADVRTCCGLALWPEIGAAPNGLAAAVAAYSSVPVFAPEEWERLCQLGPVGDRLLDTAVRSSEPAAYDFAVTHLLQSGPRTGRVARHLQTFLRAGTGRNHELRVKAALALLETGCTAGLPVLLAAEIELLGDSPAVLALGRLSSVELESLVDAALIAGASLLDRSTHDQGRKGIEGYVPWLAFGLTGLAPARPDAEQALFRVATEGGSASSRKEAMRILRTGTYQIPALRRLAEVLCWGTWTGYQLTGKQFRIELLTDESHGHTNMDERRIHVNPLPLLRGERDGDRILQGVIVHELGHHLFQNSAAARAVNRTAHAEGLGGILNLVEDEHLERNLRARNPYHGECLARMAAYVFQHSRREVPVASLLDARGDWTLDQLVGLPLSAAREPGHVAVDAGEALRHLERRGNSAVRFMRALRMGTGNRYADPKVGEALALFGNRFRHTTADQHLAISRRLREIFRGELRIVRALRFDELLAATLGELRELGECGDQVREALRHLLRGAPGSRRVTVNRSPEEHFDPLQEVVPLQHIAHEHQRLASKVRIPAAVLRRQFERMGVGLAVERRRCRGTRIDRAGLMRSILSDDPRLVTRRLPRPAADLFLALVVDCSGSMASEGKIERARLIATMVAEACHRLPGVELRVFGFTDRLLYDAGTADSCAAHALEASGGNNDAGALWHAAQAALHSRRTARLLLMVSDGLPTECSVDALKALVRRLAGKHRLACAQVAVDSLSDICFPDYVEVLETDAMGAVARFGEVLADLSMKTLRRN